MQIRRKCKCGCGRIAKLGNKYINGHNAFGNTYRKGTGKTKIRRKCECGCGEITNYGAVYIKGHNPAWNKDKKLSKDHKGNISLGMQNMSKDVRKERSRKIGLASKGNTYCLGHKLSEEHKRKISVANKGRKLSEDQKKRISKILTGKKRPDMVGANNPIHTHLNAYKSKWGKTGYRKDLGLFVRSTWEANILRMFNYLGLLVQYEPQSFKLSNGTSYRPDFYILDTGEIIEIKGFCREKDKERIKLFRKEYPGLAFDFIGPKKYYRYEQEFKHLIKNWE